MRIEIANHYGESATRISPSSGESAPVGREVIHTEDWNYVQDPNDPSQQMSMIDFLAWLNQDPARQEAAGYHEPCNMPDKPPDYRKWDVVVDAVNDAPPASRERALNLQK